MLHEALLEEIGQEIVEGRTPVGTAFTLDALSTRFAVSRTVARDTMRILESMRLITSRRRVGLVVRPPEDWDVYDPRLIQWRLDGPGREDQLRSLTELRTAVEPAAAFATAQRGATDVGPELVELAREMRALGEAGRLEEFLELDIRFHTLVLTGSGNEMFAALTDVVGEVLRGRTRHGLMPPHPAPEALEGHEQVARAVTEGDPEAAERAMALIVQEVRRALG